VRTSDRVPLDHGVVEASHDLAGPANQQPSGSSGERRGQLPGYLLQT